MSFRRGSSLQTRYAYAVLRHMVGSSRRTHLVLAVAFIFVSAVSGNCLTELFQKGPELLGAPDRETVCRAHFNAIGVALLPILVLMLWCWSDPDSLPLAIRVREDPNPPASRALVLFLSPPNTQQIDDRELINEILQHPRSEHSLENPAFLQGFRGPWRMPLTAVRHHLSRLEKIVVVASADRPTGDRNVPGTHSHVPMFRQLVESTVGDRVVGVVSLEELLRSHPRAGKAPLISEAAEPYRQGIDFESVEQLSEAIDYALKTLHELKFTSYDIAVDVTGGQKPPAIAGTGVCLAEEPRFRSEPRYDDPKMRVVAHLRARLAALNADAPLQAVPANLDDNCNPVGSLPAIMVRLSLVRRAR